MSRQSKDKVDILIATHIAEAYGPQYVLKQYLIDQGRQFAYVGCPFDYAGIPHAGASVYRSGKLQVQQSGHRNTTKGVLSWIRDAWFVWCCGRKYLSRQSVFIGINNLNAAIGILLKWWGKGNYVIYYVIDYTPIRFHLKIINWVYQRIARFAACHADMVWNLSNRMQQVHARFGAKAEANIIVPIGIHLGECKIIEEKKIDRQQLVIVSTLFESKGVQLTIAALAYLPQAKLTVIGTGPYVRTLQILAQEKGVANRVEFLGMVDRQTLFDRLAQGRIALAPYQDDPANYSYYADPAKPKEYLACGIPVIITRVPWIAEEIEKRPMGLAIDYDAQQLAQAAQRLMEDDVFWRQCRREALRFSRNSDWQGIFQRAFATLDTDRKKAKETPENRGK